MKKFENPCYSTIRYSQSVSCVYCCGGTSKDFHSRRSIMDIISPSLHLSNYGATGSNGQQPHTSIKSDFVTKSYQESSEKNLYDYKKQSTNEQTNLNAKHGQYKTKISIHSLPLYWTGKPILVRRKSESDIPLWTIDSNWKNINDNENSIINSSTSISNNNKDNGFSNQQKLIFGTIAIMHFTTNGALSIMAPFFPNEASKKGVNTALSGLIFSVYAFVLFVASPFMGSIASKIGPKTMLVFGLAVGGTANIVFALLYKIDETYVFMFSCLLVRVVEGLGAAALSTAGFIYLVEIFPNQIGPVYGILEIFVGLGMSCSPAIGGILYDWGGYPLPFYSVGGLLLITIPLNMVILPSIIPTNVSMGSTWKLLKLKPVLLVSIVTVLVSVMWSFMDPTLEPHLREFKLSGKHLGLFFLLGSVMYAFSNPFWGYISNKLTKTWTLMVVGLLMSAVSVILLGPARFTGLPNKIWLNIISLAMLGTSIAMALLPTFEAMLDFAIDAGYTDGTATYGLIAGLWSSVYYLGEVIGPMLGAFLTHHFGFPMCTVALAGICIITALIIFIYFQFVHRD